MILGMVKIICLVFIFTILPNISNSSEKIDLQKQIQSFSWNKRIVLFITKGKYIHFINEVDDFFKKYRCENEIRKAAEDLYDKCQIFGKSYDDRC